MEFDWNVVLNMVIAWRLPTILLVVVLDWAFGVLAAVRSGVFDFDKMLNAYTSNVGPWIGGYILLSGASGLVAAYPGWFAIDLIPQQLWVTIGTLVSSVGAGGIIAYVGWSVLNNVLNVFRGIPGVELPNAG